MTPIFVEFSQLHNPQKKEYVIGRSVGDILSITKGGKEYGRLRFDPIYRQVPQKEVEALDLRMYKERLEAFQKGQTKADWIGIKG
ncbi:hypothetical protein H0W91_00505 [Patescibacteria group bacterium]|nr:hypothetical protein [Patescibacteria group bacterium]